MTQATLVLRAAQQTALTPRLQQSVRLLQLSSNDFAQELEQALATNPFLDVPAAGDPFVAETDRVASGEPTPSTSADRFIDAIVVDASRADRSGVALGDQRSANAEAGFVDSVDDGAVSGSDESRFEPTDQATHEAFDFSSFGNDAAAREAGTVDVGSWAEAVTSLRMHLHGELSGHRLDERERTVTELVIEAIDDDGYLRQELDEVAERFVFDPPVSSDELETALRRVQQFGPPGIAARGVAECLSLQLEVLANDWASSTASRFDRAAIDVATTMVRDHLDLVASRDWNALRRRIGCAHEAIVAGAELIRSLDPRPGSAFGNEVAQAIVPDVIVRRIRGSWQADINPAVVPRLCLNRVYAALFHESRRDDRVDRAPLGQQLQEARWLLRNAAQRFVTIQRVARMIVAEQAAFLDYGDIAIRPLLLRQVADRLELHESTISRAIGNKFMATPRGVFAFKHFFSRKLATVSGGSCSATSIRAAMRELIDRENPSEPMSDVVLARRLTDQGLCVARRTVTKYRGLMRIPPVEMRKRTDLVSGRHEGRPSVVR